MTGPGAGAGPPALMGCVARHGKATMAVTAPRTATANITQYAAWNASAAATARAAGPAPPAIGGVREIRTVDTAATAIAPPISRVVSTSPDATPVIERATPDSAPICTD